MDLSFSWPVLGFQVLIDGPLFLWATQVLIDGPLILLAPFWLSRFWNVLGALPLLLNHWVLPGFLECQPAQLTIFGGLVL